MNAELESMDLTYVAQFTVPVFDLHVRGPDLLKAAHVSLSPTFPIRNADMQIRSGTQISDVLVGINLGARGGKINVRPSGFSVTFGQISEWNQLDIFKKCIVKINQIVRENLSNPEIDDVEIDAFIIAEVDEKDASKFFTNQFTPKKEISFDNSILNHGLYLHIRSINPEDWIAEMKVSGIEDESSLIVEFNVHYLEDFAIHSSDDRMGHFRQMLASLFDQTGLEISLS